MIKIEKIYDKKKILVVDDYLPTRNLIIEALNQPGKFEVSEAADGVEALHLFNTVHHDLVITDIMMPGMDGMQLLSSIKEIDPNTAVIMITAHPALELTVNAMKRGAVDFLKKPFDIDELLFKADFYLCDEAASEKNPVETEAKHLNAKKEELLRQSYIYDNIDNTGGNSEEVFQKIVELALRVVDGDSCALFLYDEEINEFYPKVVRNNGNGFAWHEALLKMRDLFTEVVDKKDAVMIHSDRDPLIAPSLICAPLMIKDSILGVLCIRKKRYGGAFNNNDLHHVLSLAKRASLNIENRVLYESIYRNLMDTFKSLVASIQMRDFYTEEHSYRVTDLAVKIAEGYGCSASEIASLRIASLLHDVGKISVPDNVLLKRDKLTAEEYEIIKNHPSVGEEMLSTVLLFDKERNIIRHHHERWDGGGYPSGLSGERIPLLARILAVADSFDAMTNDRPYRKGMSIDHAVVELKKNGNTQLDRKIVDIFLNVI